MTVCFTIPARDDGPKSRASALLAVAMVVACMLLSIGATTACAAAPFWHITSETSPTNLPPGEEGSLILRVSNLGDAPIDGSTSPVVLNDVLPAGLVATEVTGGVKNHVPVECTLNPVSCSFKGLLYPYEQITVTVKVKIEEPVGTGTTLAERVSVAGGGAPSTSDALSVPVSGAEAPFGLAGYAFEPFNEDGTPATQAGAHPFELTTSLAFDQFGRQPVELPKDLNFHLPPGLIGNPSAVDQCTMANFFALVLETDLCPPSSVVGVATVTANEPLFAHIVTATVPVFNLVPAQGEPARLGFEVIGKIPVVIDTSVRSGRDYGVVASIKDATQTAGVLSSEVTLWGVPGDSRHDSSRGWECVDNEAFAKEVGRSCPVSPVLEERPFLRLPTSCAVDPAGEPVVSSVEADSWGRPGSFVGVAYEWLSEGGERLGFTGCSGLPFAPAVDVVPEEHTAATPTGLSVDVKVPQKTTLEAEGLAEADVRDTTITLPAGAELSPSAANGLEGCSEGEVGFEGFDPMTGMQQFDTSEAACPDGSKVGTVRIKTPLLPNELEGAVYLASPAPNGEAGRNPFGSLVALYLVAKDPVSGVLVKLAGEGVLDEGSLRVATTFRDAPQVPFEDLKVELFGGPRASVTTPALCGGYATEGAFTPWSSSSVADVLAPAEDFQVTSGVGGGACPAGGVPFAAGFKAESTSARAGGFTGFVLELTRPDGDQALGGVSMHLPPGVAAMLSSVELCSQAQAASDSCSAGSRIGEATAVAGLGPEPFIQRGGQVYITGPYGGAPFGLEIVTPADAGPFNLGYVTVRAKLFIDPNNASVTVVSDPLPTQLRGIPLQLKRVIVEVNRPQFEFNPTSCDPMSIDGTLSGAEGATEGVSSPFQVGGCAGLPFSPRLTASAGGRGSKLDGTSLAVRVESGGVGSGGVAQAGIAKVDLQLPLALSSRLPTLQKACLEAVFDADPASCDEGSVIGEATIHTPVLSSPLTGPAYLVSHGGAEFPDVEFVLQGEGITLVLDGKTDIKHGITYSKFESAPDAPFTVFETELPAGPHGVLAPNVPEKEDFSLCKASLAMPTVITGQNGAVINQTTNIAVTGCGGVLPSKTAKPTRAQLLAKALKACRKDKHKHKRLACEKQARKRYAPKKPAHKTARKAARNATTSSQHNR
jgi:hypothetical protein